MDSIELAPFANGSIAQRFKPQRNRPLNRHTGRQDLQSSVHTAWLKVDGIGDTGVRLKADSRAIRRRIDHEISEQAIETKNRCDARMTIDKPARTPVVNKLEACEYIVERQF
jgi:hypothetical protein